MTNKMQIFWLIYLFLISSTCFGRCLLLSSGALDSIYSFWYCPPNVETDEMELSVMVSVIVKDDQQDANILANLFISNQFYMFRAKFSPITRSTWLYLQLLICSTDIDAGWRHGWDFPLVQTGPGAHPASCTMGTGSFPGVKYGRGVLLTIHPLLVPRSWNGRAITLPTIWATTGPVTGILYLLLRMSFFTYELYILNCLCGNVLLKKLKNHSTFWTDDNIVWMCSCGRQSVDLWVKKLFERTRKRVTTK
jgi:hypothetical protein